MAAAGLEQHYLYQLLDEHEYYATVIQVQRTSYNWATYGGVDGDASSGYIVDYINNPNPSVTVYEGDNVSAWIAIYNEETDTFRGFGLGREEIGYVRISGFASDDIDDVGRAAYNFWTDVENVGGVWTAEFGDNFRNNGSARQGIRVETGETARFTMDHGYIYGNGSTDQTIQTIHIDGWLENPNYDFSTGEDGDLLTGIEFHTTINYVDYADALIVDAPEEDDQGGNDDDQGDDDGGDDGDVGDGLPSVDDDPIDYIYGEAGRDVIDGGAGADWIWGYGGRDLLKGFGGDDMLFGGGGKDKLVGGGGDDQIGGGGGNDVIKGGAGADWLVGQKGRDVLKGGGGADRLEGGGGADKLIGGRGADLLKGDGGRDLLKGGGGADVFAFGARDGRDRVQDWQDGRDLMRIDAGASGFADLEIRDVRAGVAVHWAHTTVILQGEDAADIGAEDFLFV
ncbi:MAG: calcium-binding protein [Pseudomonadota bacterium]|nr:calcium-binding protein [Pseudomonadota bacterium]